MAGSSGTYIASNREKGRCQRGSGPNHFLLHAFLRWYDPDQVQGLASYASQPLARHP